MGDEGGSACVCVCVCVSVSVSVSVSLNSFMCGHFQTADLATVIVFGKPALGRSEPEGKTKSKGRLSTVRPLNISLSLKC